MFSASVDFKWITSTVPRYMFRWQISDASFYTILNYYTYVSMLHADVRVHPHLSVLRALILPRAPSSCFHCNGGNETGTTSARTRVAHTHTYAYICIEKEKELDRKQSVGGRKNEIEAARNRSRGIFGK